MKRMWRGFWLGVLFTYGLESWFEDVLGLDKYVAHVQAHWVDTSPWMGFAFTAWALLAMEFASWGRSRRKRREEQES